jgi:hypothetical protein
MADKLPYADRSLSTALLARCKVDLIESLLNSHPTTLLPLRPWLLDTFGLVIYQFDPFHPIRILNSVEMPASLR